MPQIVVLGVDMGEDDGAYRQFLADNRVAFLTIRDAQQHSNALYGTSRPPGDLRHRSQGPDPTEVHRTPGLDLARNCELPFPPVGACASCYDGVMTTNLDVLYRYELHPTEAAMIALGKARGVYGIRKIVLDEKQKTMRVEFDFTRLNRSVVMELLRTAGIDIVEEVPLAAPPAPAAEPAVPLPPK